MMNLEVAPYLRQLADWPEEGRHILAHYNSDSVIVYQAYKPATGLFAADNGYFGGDFSYNRMSWIKTNFLWTKEGQEVVLAVCLKRESFDILLEKAVHSTFVPEIYGTRDEWQQKIQASDVRLQWDPDHTPDGGKVARRAIQLGLRGKALKAYGRDWIVNIEDISGFVRDQHRAVMNKNLANLIMPKERVYPVTDLSVAGRLGISIL